MLNKNVGNFTAFIIGQSYILLTFFFMANVKFLSNFYILGQCIWQQQCNNVIMAIEVKKMFFLFFPHIFLNHKCWRLITEN